MALQIDEKRGIYFSDDPVIGRALRKAKAFDWLVEKLAHCGRLSMYDQITGERAAEITDNEHVPCAVGPDLLQAIEHAINNPETYI